MTLSIIIVSYNVKYFLEQCLCSVQKAIKSIEAEIFVIDNQSSDNSIEYLQPRFPSVRFIANRENTGFGKANNQALTFCSGTYILFLNPDTIVPEDCFEACIAFLKFHAEAGALGVKMIDGGGNYLKESKRGLPTPWVSFCKLSGLAAVFSHSRLFAGYYQGHLSENETNPVDILAGAFMMIKKEVLDQTGGFDERFFMYAEDIDLSYRIRQAGFINYFFADTVIIHFKGESTRKDIRYIKMFYKAMSQFMRKHFSGSISSLFIVLMEFAIWVRAGTQGFLQLLTRKKEVLKNNTSFLTGDLVDAAIVKNSLEANYRKLVHDKSEASEVIFCEGQGLSFKEIIGFFKEKPSTLLFKLHAAGSGGIVGSDSKDGQGETIAL